MFKRLKYLYSKVVVFAQRPSIKDSNIDKSSKIGARSNVIKLRLGKYSYIGDNASISDTQIGKFCSIASYCAIGGGGHPTNWVSTSPVFYSGGCVLRKKISTHFFDIGKTVKIGNDVWIGEKCFINSGICVGNGAIIGAHSVVTKDIPDYAVAVGSPAKVIKYRFDSSIIEGLLNIKWWDFNDSDIKKYAHLFNNPKMFIKIYNEDHKLGEV